MHIAAIVLSLAINATNTPPDAIVSATRSNRRQQRLRENCLSRVGWGTLIGAGFGAVLGASITNGDRGGAALYGLILFAPIGAAMGFSSCAP